MKISIGKGVEFEVDDISYGKIALGEGSLGKLSLWEFKKYINGQFTVTPTNNTGITYNALVNWMAKASNYTQVSEKTGANYYSTFQAYVLLNGTKYYLNKKYYQYPDGYIGEVIQTNGNTWTLPAGIKLEDGALLTVYITIGSNVLGHVFKASSTSSQTLTIQNTMGGPAALPCLAGVLKPYLGSSDTFSAVSLTSSPTNAIVVSGKLTTSSSSLNVPFTQNSTSITVKGTADQSGALLSYNVSAINTSYQVKCVQA